MNSLYYLGINHGIAIFISKKNGKGYLKSPFGGHHVNEKLLQWRYDHKPDFVGDEVDIDGYLYLNIGINSWDKDYKEKINIVLKSLEPVFPQITGWEEINGDDFEKLATRK